MMSDFEPKPNHPSYEKSPLLQLVELLDEAEKIERSLENTRPPEYSRAELTLDAAEIFNPINPDDSFERFLPDAIKDLCLTRSIDRLLLDCRTGTKCLRPTISMQFIFDDRSTATIYHSATRSGGGIFVAAFEPDALIDDDGTPLEEDIDRGDNHKSQILPIEKEEVARLITSLSVEPEFADKQNQVNLLDIHDSEQVGYIVSKIMDDADSAIVTSRYFIDGEDGRGGYIQIEKQNGETVIRQIGKILNTGLAYDKDLNVPIEVQHGIAAQVIIGGDTALEVDTYEYKSTMGSTAPSEHVLPRSEDSDHQILVITDFIRDELSKLQDHTEPAIVPLDESRHGTVHEPDIED